MQTEIEYKSLHGMSDPLGSEQTIYCTKVPTLILAAYSRRKESSQIIIKK